MAPISTLTVRLSAQIAEFQSEFRNATKTAEQFAGNFEGIATRAAAVGTFIGTIAARIATSLASAFGQGLKDAIRLSSEFSNAFIGLSSVARAFGTDADLATKAAQGLSSDGLLPLKDSATGLKNLLATGFSLDQSVQLMNAFKDAAAFGRQGALSFGDAVRSATEGVKNGNSILVDNAGITKNLSQILKEAGFSAQDLSRASSDASVRLALFNGILKESAAFAGDAARLTETYSGNISRLDFAYNNLLATLGAAITQNATVARAIGAVADAFFSLNTNLVANRNAFNLVSDGVIFLVRSLSGILNAVDLVQTGFAGLQIASNRLFEAFANIGSATFRLVERIANLQQYLDPINMRRHAAAAEEAREAYTFLEGAAQGLRDASRDAQARSESLGNALQSVRAKADKLAAELKETRGKTIELGTAAGRAGVDLSNDLGGGADKAAEKLKKLADGLRDLPLLARRAVADLRNVVFVPGSGGGIAQVFIEQIENIPPSSLRSALTDKLDAIFQTITFDDTWVARNAIAAAKNGNKPEVKAEVEKTFREVFVQPLGEIGAAIRAIGDNLGGTFGQFLSFAGSGVTLLADMADGFSRVADSTANFASRMAGATTILGAYLQGIALVHEFNRDTPSPLQELEAQIADDYGSIENALRLLGVRGEEFNERLRNTFARRSDPNQESQADVIRDITAALDEYEQRFDRMVSGINSRADIFAAPFRKIQDAIREATTGGDDELAEKLGRDLMHAAEVGQAAFERLGIFTGATFAALVRDSGDAIGAIRQMEPAFRALQEGVNDFGLMSTGVIDQLLNTFNLVTDEVTGPMLDAIQATGDIFIGLSDAGYLTAELFQTVGADIGESFREIEAAGGDVAAAMALSQPILQRLWEGQQLYGDITDETTAALLRQAEEQGLVGAHMQDVNQKILDVLIAIADVFGADIPNALRGVPSAAEEAAKGIRGAFDSVAADAERQALQVQQYFRGIRVPPLEIDIQYNDPGFGGSSGSLVVPALAAGGVVTRPTLALVGEAGPEAVVPLSQLGSFSGDGFDDDGTTVIFEVDGQAIAEATVPHIPGVVRRYGLV